MYRTRSVANKYAAFTYRSYIHNTWCHYNDVIMSVMPSQITSLTIVYSTVYLGAAQRKHQSFASLAFVRGIHRWPVNSPQKGPVTRKRLPFDDVIMAGDVWEDSTSGGCFTNVSRALQNILSNFGYRRNRTSYANFKLTLCTCATKFQLEILTINVISGIVYFREIVLESSRNVSETTPGWCQSDARTYRMSTQNTSYVILTGLIRCR